MEKSNQAYHIPNRSSMHCCQDECRSTDRWSIDCQSIASANRCRGRRHRHRPLARSAHSATRSSWSSRRRLSNCTASCRSCCIRQSLGTSSLVKREQDSRALVGSCNGHAVPAGMRSSRAGTVLSERFCFGSSFVSFGATFYFCYLMEGERFILQKTCAHLERELIGTRANMLDKMAAQRTRKEANKHTQIGDTRTQTKRPANIRTCLLWIIVRPLRRRALWWGTPALIRIWSVGVTISISLLLRRRCPVLIAY